MRLKYLGGGWVPGVPARDMDDEELTRRHIDEATVGLLVATGLYEVEPDNEIEESNE